MASDVTRSVTDVVGAIASLITESVDTTGETFGIWSACDLLKSTISEARNSNTSVLREAGIDDIDA